MATTDRSSSARRRASSGSAASTSTTPCWPTSTPRSTGSSATSTRRTPPCGPPSPAYASSARQPKRRCPPTPRPPSRWRCRAWRRRSESPVGSSSRSSASGLTTCWARSGGPCRRAAWRWRISAGCCSWADRRACRPWPSWWPRRRGCRRSSTPIPSWSWPPVPPGHAVRSPPAARPRQCLETPPASAPRGDRLEAQARAPEAPPPDGARCCAVPSPSAARRRPSGRSPWVATSPIKRGWTTTERSTPSRRPTRPPPTSWSRASSPMPSGRRTPRRTRSTPSRPPAVPECPVRAARSLLPAPVRSACHRVRRRAVHCSNHGCRAPPPPRSSPSAPPSARR